MWREATVSMRVSRFKAWDGWRMNWEAGSMPDAVHPGRGLRLKGVEVIVEGFRTAKIVLETEDEVKLFKAMLWQLAREPGLDTEMNVLRYKLLDGLRETR